ncbi:MAG: lysylphosphatidylglycerol synthase transmembrane domain-containing protein [Gemmatimonadota bacterium]
MNLKVRFALFVVGFALAAVVVLHVGPAVIWGHLRQTGWLLLPVVLVWAVVYTLNTVAWYTMLGLEPARPTFLRSWAISVSTFALNYIAPAAGLAGEGYRALSVAPWLGRQRAIGSVVQYRLLFSLAHMLFVFTAVIPAIFLLPHTAPILTLLIATALGVALVIWFLIRRHHEGILEAGLDFLLMIPGLRRLARRLEPRRLKLRELDLQVTTLYQEHPAVFWRAIGLEFLARCVMPFELAIIFWGLGLGVRIPEAFLATALSTTILNLLFFLPFELGAREGGLFLVFSLLGFGADQGVFAAVVTRLRELVWALIGLLLLWAHGDRVSETVKGVEGAGAE